MTNILNFANFGEGAFDFIIAFPHPVSLSVVSNTQRANHPFPIGLSERHVTPFDSAPGIPNGLTHMDILARTLALLICGLIEPVCL